VAEPPAPGPAAAGSPLGPPAVSAASETTTPSIGIDEEAGGAGPSAGLGSTAGPSVTGNGATSGAGPPSAAAPVTAGLAAPARPALDLASREDDRAERRLRTGYGVILLLAFAGTALHFGAQRARST
jgi:hypothetical protein